MYKVGLEAHAGSWTTVREISLLLRCLVVQLLPVSLPSAQVQPLCAKQVSAIGSMFVEALTSVKHNGATEKLQQGLEGIAHALLRAASPELTVLPSQWLTQLLAYLQSTGQTRTSIVRRSAGSPLAIQALCHAESQLPQRPMLLAALQQLLAIATCTNDGQSQQQGQQIRASSSPQRSDSAAGQAAVQPWPRVHAFNCLRVLFDSATLSADASARFADGVQACVEAMTAAEWEVRAVTFLAPCPASHLLPQQHISHRSAP